MIRKPDRIYGAAPANPPRTQGDRVSRTPPATNPRPVDQNMAAKYYTSVPPQPGVRASSRFDIGSRADLTRLHAWLMLSLNNYSELTVRCEGPALFRAARTSLDLAISRGTITREQNNRIRLVDTQTKPKPKPVAPAAPVAPAVPVIVTDTPQTKVEAAGVSPMLEKIDQGPPEPPSTVKAADDNAEDLGDARSFVYDDSDYDG
jgi:hypothetical protein